MGWSATFLLVVLTAQAPEEPQQHAPQVMTKLGSPSLQARLRPWASTVRLGCGVTGRNPPTCVTTVLCVAKAPGPVPSAS